MKQESLHKIQKIFLLLTIILLPFTNLPKKITFSSIGPNIVHYIIIISLFLIIYEYYKYKCQINKIIFYFFSIYIISQFISLVYGLFTYPYYGLLDVQQLPKLQYLVNKFNISVSSDTVIAIWLFIRETKNIILDSVYICVVPFMFIHLFEKSFDKNKEKVFSFVEKAVIILVCLLGLYSVPEIIYLKFGNPVAKSILETINPFLYDVAHTHTWWPPLLWTSNGGQLRSLCPEPPFFCIIAIFCIPFLFRLIYNKFSFKYIALFSYFVFMLFMSKSRTGLIIFILELFILFVFLIYKFNKKNLYFLIILLLCISFSMSLNLYSANKGNETFKNYIYDNVVSGVQLNKRSNKARLANIVMLFEIGIKKPVLGVGRGLKDAYMLYNIPNFAKNDSEVILWQKLFKQNGLKSIFPVLNQYVYVFAERGFTGLIVFILPLIYIFYVLYKNKFLLNSFDFIIVLITFIGQLFTMLLEPYFITYSLSLGLVFLYISSVTNNNSIIEYNVK